jgi:hypothetical protein
MSDLSEELTVLENQWAAGKRDASIARRILFISWYVAVEPSFVTDMDGTPPSVKQVWDDVLSVAESSAHNDLESALVLGYMISFAPYVFGSDEMWLPKAETLLETAYKIAEEHNRTKSELGQIGYHLAIAVERVNKKQSSDGVTNDDEGDVDETFFESADSDLFPDMFVGESEYDCYFAHIFGCRK